MRLRNSFVAAAACLILGNTVGAQSTRAPSDNEIRLYARVVAMTDTRAYDAALLDSVLASS